MELEERITHAVELFKSGFNCSQSVVAAFADMYALPVSRLCTCLLLLAPVSGGCV